jgi:hypothetical protein
MAQYGKNATNLMYRSYSNNKAFKIIEVKNNILEEGMKCFTHWLSSEGNSKKWRVFNGLNKFEKDKR